MSDPSSPAEASVVTINDETELEAAVTAAVEAGQLIAQSFPFEVTILATGDVVVIEDEAALESLLLECGE